MNIAVLVPVFNGEKHLPGLLKDIRRYIKDIIIVDDGSTDKSALLAKQEGAFVIGLERNEGKGAAIRRGIDYLRNKDYDAVIMMDADAQHKPQEIPRFIESFERSQAGIIIGNRMQDASGMPAIRYLTNKTMSKIISRICRREIPDSQCGFRLIRKDLLKKIKLSSSNYEIESEILIKAAQAGFKIESVPITTIYREEKSYVNPIIDTFRFIKLLFHAYRKKDE